MDLALVVSIVSLGISAGSIAYAHCALQASRDANRVGLHQTHLKIFNAMLDFRTHFVELDLHPTSEEMDSFYRKAVGPAQLYLPSEFVAPMYSIYRKSRDLYKKIEQATDSKEKWEATNELQRIGNEDLDQLIRKVADHVSLVAG